MSMDMIQRLNELPEDQQLCVLIDMLMDVQKSVQRIEKNTADAIERLDTKITPMVELYTKVQTLGWVGKVVLGLVLGLMALAVGITNFWRVFGPPKP